MDSMSITLLTLAGTIVLLISGAIRADLVAAGVIMVLMGTKVLSPAEALSGFSSNVVVIIATMFIVGKAITHSGIAQRVGGGIIRHGGSSETRLMIMIMLAAGAVGAFMSSTATAAIFIPIVLSVAEKAGINHKRLLMPLAAAALVSGMMTLIATTPNIIINSALAERGQDVLGFFSFTPFGVIVLLLCIAFLTFGGVNLLAPKGAASTRKRGPSINDLLEHHQIAKYEYMLVIPDGSPLIGHSAAELRISSQHHITMLAMRTTDRAKRRRTLPAWPDMAFHANDKLLCIATPEHIKKFAEHFGVHAEKPSAARLKDFFQVVGVAEVMLNPDAGVIGKTLKESMFQSLYHCLVLGVRRKGETLTDNLGDLTLTIGDVLLVCGPWNDVLRLEQNRENYLLLTLPRDYREVVPGADKEPLTLAIIAFMVLAMVFNLLPPVAAIFGAAVILVLTNCVPKGSIYQSIDWQSVVLIAGIIPLAVALQKTGVVDHITDIFFNLFVNSSPLLVLGGLFLLTAALGLFMSNSATAVLVAPMAVEVGIKFGISTQACAMAVAIACSSAFVSPLGSPVHMIVREPGGYSFADYAKVGAPMLVISLAVTLTLCWGFYF